jgi:hypothetical protein
MRSALRVAFIFATLFNFSYAVAQVEQNYESPFTPEAFKCGIDSNCGVLTPASKKLTQAPQNSAPPAYVPKADNNALGQDVPTPSLTPLQQPNALQNKELFDPEGRPVKCYIVTRDTVFLGVRVGIDPITGRECRPVTPEIVERIQKYSGGNRPTRIADTDPIFFEPRTGEPIIWYAINKENRIELFDLMGFHPDTGEELLPVTKEVVVNWTAQSRQGSRTSPKPVDPNRFAFFDSITGKGQVWYVKDESGDYEFFESPGFHPRTGQPLSIITNAAIEEWKEHERSKLPPPPPPSGPKRVDPQTYPFFNPNSGQPQVWYLRNPDGEYEFYDLPGFNPLTGHALLAITKEVVEEWQKYASRKCYVITRDSVKYLDREGIDSETGRQCRLLTPELVERLREYEKGKRAKRITNGSPTFFDARSGEPLVWYYQRTNGTIELFDLMGFHPDTGEELIPVTKEIVANWKGQREQAGRISKGVDPQGYPFFNSNTGQPQVWYIRNSDGEYEFYDFPGFNPHTGQPLSEITKQVIEEWHKQTSCTPPKIIDPTKHPFFDPITGNGQVWYTRIENGDYEFFDCSGFHPRTGQPLLLITNDATNDWQKYEKDKNANCRGTAAPRAHQRVDIQTYDPFDRITGAPRVWYWRSKGGEWEQDDDLRQKKQKEEADKRLKQAKAQEAAGQARAQREAAIAGRRTEIARRCDELAGNPTDQHRVGNGVSFERLKLQVKDAVASCERAVKTNPKEPRFKYQMARALEYIDRRRALSIQQELVKAGYPAAHDNLGWLIISEQKNYQKAVAVFRTGVAVGDPDSMVSLVTMYDKGYAMPRGKNETKNELLSRAAQLGNENAAREVAIEGERERERESQAKLQRRAMDRAADVMRLFLQNIPRR